MSENSTNYRTAVDGLSAVVESAPVSAWSALTPCAGWTGAHLIGHLVGGTQMISAVDTGIGPDYNADLVQLAGSDPATSFAQARDVALAALTDTNLAAVVPGPMGEMPLDQMIGMFLVGDVLVHTWDLATAAGQEVTLDPQLCQKIYDQILPLDAMIRMPNVFGPKVEPPANASAQTALLCFTGRRAG